MTKWLDRTLFASPYHYCLCTDQQSFNKILKKIEIEESIDFLPEGSYGCVHTFITDKQERIAVVSIDPWMEVSPARVHAVIAHEAVHIWQYIRDFIGEDNPSSEFEAYCVQAISGNLIEEYEKQVKPQEIKKTKKKKAK